MPSQAEDRQLQEVEIDLTKEFPTVPREQVHDLVHHEAEAFAGAKVRDYVALLVHRTVRARLR